MLKKQEYQLRAKPYSVPIRAGKRDVKLRRLYGEEQLPIQRKRYAERVERLFAHYGEMLPPNAELRYFSAPGRTEIIGNHTDHNLGKVLGAGVNLDVIAVAAPVTAPEVRIKSKGHPEIVIRLDDRGALKPGGENGNSQALVRGILAGFQKRGFKILEHSGFVAATDSDVPPGSGLSSSAAFEVLVATIVSKIMLGKEIPPTIIAQIAQEAEELFYGKPCGLLDQTTSAVGGCVAIDFMNPRAPQIKKINMDLSKYGKSGYSLCIVNTGGDHKDLTDEYAAIRAEMVQVAAEQIRRGLTTPEYIAVKKKGAFDPDVLRYMSEQGFKKSIPALHEKGLVGDRAILRAMHFYEENRRVERLIRAIREGADGFEEFLATIIESGQSSYMYNQNIFPLVRPDRQPVALGLALSEEMLHGCGAWRVHGGGFAGTIQAFVPNEKVVRFKSRMNKTFGNGATYVLRIRPFGGVEVL
ncbi:MAG: galactokinase [Oscillospiraceae bacterium]|nr:galactokinase [Oscillospiraceae bacterium]